MAKQETDREDILREATALVNRVELQLPEVADRIVFGFRSDGSLSIYFGMEPVYQFNTDHELRRGYHAGCLLKAQQRLIVSMRRQREGGKLQLLSTTWDQKQTDCFVQTVQTDLSALANAIRSEQNTVTGFAAVQEKATAQMLLAEFCQWCDEYLANLRVALTPHVSA